MHSHVFIKYLQILLVIILAILDSIYTYIVLNSKNKAQREIFNTEYVLQSKKI